MGWRRKLAFGPWFEQVLRQLARGKRLRGTVLDPFRWAEVRRVERALPDAYRAGIERMLPHLDRSNLHRASAIAATADTVRGYEDLKLRRVAQFRTTFANDVATLATRQD